VTGRHALPEALRQLRDRWTQRLEEELPGAIALRHALHAEPDLSGQEGPTTARVVGAIGAGVGEVVAGTGRVLRLGPLGPAVGLRAELDALPVTEATGAPFAALGGAMHACGHDVHLAALTALARAAGGLELPAGLVIVLQPREEVGPTGAQDVLDAGVLTALDVRYLIGAHVQPQLAAGALTSDPGPVNAAVDEIEIEVIGRGGHGAYPHLALDPVPALCKIVLGLQDAARSAVDPLQPVVVSVTQLEGAGAPNVIPGIARAAGTIRTMRPQDAAALHGFVERMVVQTAAAHGCTGRYLVCRGEPALDNDAGLAHAAHGWLTSAGQPVGTFASCGSDDFATYGTIMPILMLFVGSTVGSTVGSIPVEPADGVPVGHPPMLHDARFLPADDRIRDVAVALMSGWLAGAQLLAEASEIELPVVSDPPAR
jgi:amidohydrolase